MPETPIPLREVRVRPVRLEEEPQWNALLRAHHYLGFRKLCGAQLKQVAVWGDRWLALLGWQEAALHCGPRDRWLGWTSWQRRARLHLVANPSRFLLLPSAGRTPRLASRVLGLSLRRLPADWQARTGRPLLLVETFVDPARFAGTCYRAANWLPLGRTQGFGRQRGHALSYVAHGQPKAVWVYPLHRRARAWLAAPATPAAWTLRRNRLTLTPAQLESLWLHLRRVPDFRSRRGLRHPLPTGLAIVLASRLAGAKTPKASAECAARLTPEQLQRLGARTLAGTYRAPSYNTIRRVLQGVDPLQLEAECDTWMAAQGAACEPFEALALDGKTLRGSYDHDLQEDGTEAAEAPQQQLSAVGIDTRTVSGSLGFIGAKEDAEPQAFRTLVRHLGPRVAGRCLMADALHTSRATAELILSLEASYLLPVKGNQKTLLAWLSQDRIWADARSYRQPDYGHGRIEHRTIEGIRLDRPRTGPACPDFPGVRVAARVRREVEFVKTGEQREPAVAYLISNLRPQQAAPKMLLEMNRKYWGAVENGLHRVRDGALAEDHCRVRKGYLPRAMAVFANLALTILRLQEVANIAAEMRAFAANAAAALDLVAI